MKVLILVLGGMFFWTFLEYVLHRFLGHWILQKNEFYIEHNKHHAIKDYFASGFDKLKASLIAVVIVFPLSVLIFGAIDGIFFTMGTISCYLIYEWLHRRIHVEPPIANNRYGFLLRKHHLVHHFVSPHLNHGVTSPFWDFVFRTKKSLPLVRVPRKMGNEWLFDNKNQGIKPAYKQYFT